MTEEKFDEIVQKAWDACNEVTNEGLSASATSMEYSYYKNADEKDVWNDAVFDFKEAVLSYREMYEDFDYEEEYALLNDVLSDILR